VPSSDGCTRTIVEPALAVRLVRDAATHWMIGLVAFRARVDRTGKCAPAVAASGFVSARAELPVDCTRAFAADLAARQACTAGHDAGKGDARAVLGGPNGCLGRALPQGESLATWTAALRGAFATFRLSGASTQLSADPLETNGAVLEVARAIRERTTLSLGMPKPSDAASGPSSCREAVHTYEELRLAAARWLGAPAPYFAGA
jgi:hypothetical protein